MKLQNKGFTLVELIVVITILAILATIAFISFQSYSKNTRDGVRISDLKNIKKILSLYNIEDGFYPEVSNPKSVTFSGAIIWNQGTFGNVTRAALGSKLLIDHSPFDPLTNNEYSYSVTVNKQEYQLGAGIENDDSSSLYLGNKSYAGVSNLKTYIIGDYNGKIVKVSTGGLDYIITTPSIIASNLSGNTDIFDILEGKKLSYLKYLNLPSSYSGAINQNLNKSFDFSGGGETNIVFKGNFKELYSDKEKKKELFEKIAKRYNQSILYGENGYDLFSNVESNSLNPTEQYINYTCIVMGDLLNDKDVQSCNNEKKNDILSGTAYTGTLLLNGETNYYGQWPLGDVYNYGQGIQTANHDRTTLGLRGGLNKTIGIKWKLFTKNKNASDYFGGEDINGDGKENLLYSFGGKIIIGDINSGNIVWQTKPLGIKKVLGIENIMGDGSKSIIVALGEDWYLGIINGKTGKLDWTSNNVLGTVKRVKVGIPGLNYKIFDINGDGINEYHFKQWYHKYHSFKFFKSGNKVIGESLWSSEGFGNYNENTTDGYQPYVWSMGKLSNKLIVGTKGTNTFSFYSNDVNSNLSVPDKFKMPAFAKLNHGGDSGHGRSRSLGYFYDIDGDGNDEYIARIDKELNNNKHTRIITAGLDPSGNMKQFMSLASSSGASNFYKPIALKNYSNPSDSYILSYGEDPISLTNKWLLFKYNGITISDYKKDSGENESFNYSIIYNKFDSNYTPVGIYNNGIKDYIVLRKGSYYYFYTFNGVDTFKAPLIESPLKINGNFFGDSIFGDGYDIKREQNKDSGVFLSSYDTNGNGKKEFVVADGGSFKFYEIEDSGVNLLKTFSGYASIPSRQKYGITKDNKDMYIISYNGSKNTINYYRTDSISGSFIFEKKTNDTFYSGGQTNDMVISKLGGYNRLMIKGVGMFDARNATPTQSPIKISNEFFNSYDMDRDGYNEIFINGKAYTYNNPGNYTLKYNSEGWQGDIDGDGVLDRSYSYCASNNNFPNNLFYTIRSGKDNSEIIPDFDWGNGNGWCTGGSKYSGVSEDFDGDGKDDFVVGTAARASRIISLSGSINNGFTINEGEQIYRNSSYNLVAYDFDGDGVKEIIRNHDDDFKVYKIDENNKTKLNLLFSITRQLKSTWGKDLGLPSLYTDNETGKVYISLRGVDGEIALYSWQSNEGVRLLFKNYYLYTKKYNSESAVFNDGFIPIPNADILIGDFMNSGDPQVLIAGGDGYVYLVGLDGNLIRAFNIGSAIKRIIIGDTNDDLLIDILVGSENGFIYQISSARLNNPSVVKDGIAGDISKQLDTKKSGLNFSSVKNATGYYVQLYNYTKKQAVFDFENIGNKTSACIVSNNYNGDIGSCIKINKNFSLETGVIYVWRVQAYNDNMTSPNSLSNGFYIDN